MFGELRCKLIPALARRPTSSELDIRVTSCMTRTASRMETRSGHPYQVRVEHQ
jgi:hypothetical protein